MLLQLLVVIVEVAELVGQDVGVRTEIKGTLSKALLEANDVEAKSVFACDFIALREVVYLLVLIQSLILVGLAGA